MLGLCYAAVGKQPSSQSGNLKTVRGYTSVDTPHHSRRRVTVASFVRMLISKTLDISTEVPRRTTCPLHLRPVRRMLHQVRQPMMHRAPCQANDNLDGDCQRHWGKERDTLMKRVVGINILINNIPIRIRTWPGETDPNPNLGRRNRSESEPGLAKPIRIRTWPDETDPNPNLARTKPIRIRTQEKQSEPGA